MKNKKCLLISSTIIIFIGIFSLQVTSSHYEDREKLISQQNIDLVNQYDRIIENLISNQEFLLEYKKSWIKDRKKLPSYKVVK